MDTGRVPFTAAEATRWLLRNLAILMGAFLPALLIAGSIHACVRDADGRCSAAIPFIVPLVWMWFALPLLVVAGLPVCLILLIAWRWPRLARVLAILFPLAFVLASAGPGWILEHPRDVPLVTLGVLYFGCMLRLDPRQPLREAAWVWWVPLELAAFAMVLAITGVI